MENRNSDDRLVLAAAQNTRERDYWLRQLSGDLEKSTLPYDFNDHLKKDQNPLLIRKEAGFQFSPTLYAKMEKLSGGIDIKRHMILAAGLVLLLHKYRGRSQSDILIGSPILRQKSAVRFINTVLVFRNRVHECITFKELLLQVRETVIDANEHQNYPMEILSNQLNLPVSPHEFPLFEIVLLLESLHDPEYIKHLPYRVLFSFKSTGNRIEGIIRYDASLYCETTIQRLTGHYLHLLAQVLSDVNLRLSSVDILPESERKQLLTEFNQTPLPNSKTFCGGPGGGFSKEPPGRRRQLIHQETAEAKVKTLPQLLTEQAAKTPDHVALVGKEERSKKRRETPEVGGRVQITYRELAEASACLAEELKAKGVRPDTLVATMVPPDVQMIIGLLGILEAGGAYLPMDPDWPRERIRYILQDSGAGMLLTGSQIQSLWDPGWSQESIRLCTGSKSAFSVLTSGSLRENSVRPIISWHFGKPASSLAYLIYTSGTTGKPKGVMVTHRNVTHYLDVFCREFAVSCRDRVIQLASYAFDAFVEEVFPVLSRGGRLVIPTMAERVDMDLLSRLILEEAVTIIDCTPLLLNEFNLGSGEGRLDTVRLFISGGDVLKPAYIDHLVPLGKIYNTYGPTETTVCATYYPCPAETGANPVGEALPSPLIPPPIGKPITGYRIYITGETGQLMPIGVPGELSISGTGVTRGYLNRPELTRDRYDLDLPDLHDNHDKKSKGFCGESRGSGAVFLKSAPLAAGGKIYKTGDLACWLADGNIRFLGRIDQQVKIRGYRIELAEIEHALRRHDRIQTALVTARVDESGENYLCAYVVSVVSRVSSGGREETGLDSAALREYLLQQLPDYMVPSYFVPLEAIPLNHSGKPDKWKLPAPEAGSTSEYVPPANPLERQLVEVFTGLLPVGREKIGINDDFFQLGGNSLKLIKLTTRLQEQFKTRLPLARLLKKCTVKEISGLIVGSTFAAAEEEIIVLLNREKPGKIFFFPPGIGYGIAYLELAMCLEDYSFYAFNFIDDNETVEAYADTLERLQPRGPLVLAAYSAGGRLCLKTAELLEKRGRQVAGLILMECFLYGEKLTPAQLEKITADFLAGFKQMLKDLGMEALTGKAIRKITQYTAFLSRLSDFVPVEADIHFIKAGDKREQEEPAEWKQLTRGQYRIYDGFGTHARMLAPGPVEKNAHIFKQILSNTLPSEAIPLSGER